MLRSTSFAPVLALVALAAAAGPSLAQPSALRYPRLHAALYELREARREIKTSKVDFGGRRLKALITVDATIKSLKTIFGVTDEKIGGLVLEQGRYKGYKNYPRVRRALEDLRDAREELRKAEGDLGGKKDQAIRDIDYAIFELSELLQYARA